MESMEALRALWGGDAPALLEALRRPPVAGLRVNALKGVTPPPWEKVAWCPQGVIVPQGVRPGRHPLHAAGAYYLQEPSAMAPVQALGARPGERVLDLCAAPGGKSTQIAGALQGKGLLVANEIHPARARALLENLERLGVANAVALCETPQRLAAHFGPYFDRVLVDAPCSGEGLFRRDPAARAQWTPQTPAACQQRQLAILEAASALVRGGGVLVYSTCTFNQVENEGTVERFLASHPGFELDARLQLPGVAARGGMARLFPHQVKGEGQFLCRMLCLEEREPARLPPLDGVGKPDPRYLVFAQAALPGFAPSGFLTQGEWLYAPPEGAPRLRGLRVLRAGLQLGRLAPGRLEPAHALALAVEGAPRFLVDQEQAFAYLQGEALPMAGAGWGVASLDGFALGWGKCGGGMMKNHYPKGLRWTGRRTILE